MFVIRSQSIFVFAWAHVLVQGSTAINFKMSLSMPGKFSDIKTLSDMCEVFLNMLRSHENKFICPE